MSDKKAFEQVMAARFLTQTFEGLHQLQVDNLIMYGYLVFQHIEFGELDLAADMPSKVIQYTLRTERRMPGRVAHLIPMLQTNVQTLLGPEWDILVIHGGKTIFGEKRDIATKINERRRQAARGPAAPDTKRSGRAPRVRKKSARRNRP